jgi:hypothetical protein
MAAEVFNAFTIDTADVECSAPDNNLLLFFQSLCEELPPRTTGR